MQERVVLTCSAPYRVGGIGQHFAEVVERFRRAGTLSGYLSPGCRPGDEAIAPIVRAPLWPAIARYTPVRLSQGWSTHLSNDLFDRAAARRLSQPLDEIVAFNGQALRTFHRAAALGCRRFALVAATAHVNHVARQHEKALAYGADVEPGWLNGSQLRKTLREYERADTIYVGSEYARQTFVDEGVRPERLIRMHYPVESRFGPSPRPPGSGFRIVYTGALSVSKGIPVLLDAFARFRHRDAELVLVGGSSSRGMRRFLEQRLRDDRRVRVAPGDPLPHLQRANVYVHPSFQDGFGYAPMEALACGVPVIVTDQTGMKEHVVEGVNGFVVAAGDADATVDRLYRIAALQLRQSPA